MLVLKRARDAATLLQCLARCRGADAKSRRARALLCTRFAAAGVRLARRQVDDLAYSHSFLTSEEANWAAFGVDVFGNVQKMPPHQQLSDTRTIGVTDCGLPPMWACVGEGITLPQQQQQQVCLLRHASSSSPSTLKEDDGAANAGDDWVAHLASSPALSLVLSLSARPPRCLHPLEPLTLLYPTSLPLPAPPLSPTSASSSSSSSPLLLHRSLGDVFLPSDLGKNDTEFAGRDAAAADLVAANSSHPFPQLYLRLASRKGRSAIIFD